VAGSAILLQSGISAKAASHKLQTATSDKSNLISAPSLAYQQGKSVWRTRISSPIKAFLNFSTADPQLLATLRVRELGSNMRQQYASTLSIQ
jgi:hypothetical protein